MSAKATIEEIGHFQYTFLQVADDIGANCLYLNNTLIHVSHKDFPQSCVVFEELKTDARKIPLSATEMNAVDGCFTCCSVLIK